jgi:hypothetical protein
MDNAVPAVRASKTGGPNFRRVATNFHRMATSFRRVATPDGSRGLQSTETTADEIRRVSDEGTGVPRVPPATPFPTKSFVAHATRPMPGPKPWTKVHGYPPMSLTRHFDPILAPDEMRQAPDSVMKRANILQSGGNDSSHSLLPIPIIHLHSLLSRFQTKIIFSHIQKTSVQITTFPLPTDISLLPI